jgi:peptide/nickel transport system substrate-binding protein
MKGIKKSVVVLLALSLGITLFTGYTKTEYGIGRAAVKKTPATQSAATRNSNPLSDVRVRRAMAYALDMQALIDKLLGGQAVAANSLTPNNSWKTTGLTTYKYNPKKARALLKEAKWNSNYVIHAVYYYGDQQTVDLMTAIQAYFANVGIKMTIRKLEGDLAAKLWKAPQDPVNGPSVVDWDLAYGAIAAVSEYEYYNRFAAGSPTNSHTPGDPTLDKYLASANSTTDIKAQKAAFAKIQKYENTYLPIIPLYYQELFVVESDRLDRKGASYGNAQYNYDWKIQNWQVKPDKNGKRILRANGGPVEFFETPFVNPGQFMSTKVLYDHLIVADGQLEKFRGQLASKYQVRNDGLKVEFTMKDGLKWHDGSALTAQDVKWTWEIAAKVPALNVLFNGLVKSLDGYQDYLDGKTADIKGIVINGNKITFNFAKVYPNALVAFSQLPPLPRKYFEGVDPLLIQRASYWQRPIGSGPFKIEKVAMNNYAVFVPFEKYHEGVAQIDQIVLYPSGESDPNIVKNASAGQLDYAYTKSLDDVKALKQLKNIKVTPFAMNYTRLLYVNKFPKAKK